MPARGVDRIKFDFKHKVMLDFAHRAKPIDRVGSNPFVESMKFDVGEPRIGFADGHDRIFMPHAEGVIRIERRSLSAAALGVKQHAIEQERVDASI